MGAERRVDEKGRVTLPKEIRERLGIDAGERVTIQVTDGSIRIRPDVDREAARTRLRGCINEDTRVHDEQPIDPLDTKRLWTSDFPE